MKRIFSILTVFVLAFCLTVPAFAYELGSAGERDVPSAEMLTYFDEGYEYAVYVDYGNNTYYMYQSTAPMYQNTVNGYLLASAPLDYVRFTWNTNDSKWVYVNKGSLSAGQEYKSQAFDIVWSGYNIKDHVGNIIMTGDSGFFPLTPLAEMVLEVTEGELVTVTIPNLVGVLKILVPFGVGLMASLAVLKLFGKRSLIFRS